MQLKIYAIIMYFILISSTPNLIPCGLTYWRAEHSFLQQNSMGAMSEVAIFFFWQCLNLFSNPFTKTEGKVACVLLFTGLCLASVSKCINRFAITWASASLYPPHAQVAALMGFIMRRCSAGAERLSWAAVGNNNTGQRMATMWAVPDCKQPMDWGLDMPDISRT